MSDSNKPAFPRPGFTERETESQEGMTLLEYYAGQALMGINASIDVGGDDWTREGIAQECVRQARALIAELNEYKNP